MQVKVSKERGEKLIQLYGLGHVQKRNEKRKERRVGIPFLRKKNDK